MSEVENAEKTLRELTSKREAIVARTAQLADERQQIAFAAHTGDKAARKKLDHINQESAEQASEIASIDAAIVEAQTRLQSAQQAELAEQERARARELRKVVTRFVQSGRALDQALATLTTESQNFRDILTEMHKLGGDHPSHGLADVNAVLAVRTALMQTPWARAFEMVPPLQRKNFTDLVEGWAATIEPTIERKLEAA